MIQASLEAPRAQGKTMQVETLIKGLIDVDESQVITFTQPLVGMEHLKEFIILATDNGPMYWLQSTQDMRSAFCIMSPFDAGIDVDMAIGRDDLKDLETDDITEVSVYTMVVLEKDPNKTRTNLRAPILCCPRTGKAKQIVIDDPKLPVQFHLSRLLRPHSDN